MAMRLPIVVALALLALSVEASAPPTARVALARAAAGQIGVTTQYDPAYVKLRYPGGDVPLDRGVCSDVVVRAFRAVGIDLQKEIHEDMRRNFRAYPALWGMPLPDPNIDHRRVPNLMAFFDRRGKRATGAYEAGDVVAFRLPGGLYHVGIISTDFVPGTNRPYVVHNIGRGAEREDILFVYQVIGHYRW